MTNKKQKCIRTYFSNECKGLLQLVDNRLADQPRTLLRGTTSLMGSQNNPSGQSLLRQETKPIQQHW